jgi:hypothetical protein
MSLGEKHESIPGLFIRFQPVLSASTPGRGKRSKGKNFSVSEIRGFDTAGSPLIRSKWHATNFFGAQAPPSRILHAVHTINRFWPGQELAVAVYAGETKLDPVDDVYVVARVGDQIITAPIRAPSYPYHNYEWNSW